MNYPIPSIAPLTPITPGPRPISTIKNDALERFAGLIFVTVADDKDINDYLSDYDNVEPYSESQTYSKRIYQAAYKGKMRDYQNYLCIVKLGGNENENFDNLGEKYFVVAKNVRNELEKLEEFCECATCSASFINPLKYMWCPTCTGCIKAGKGFVDKKYIELAEKRKNSKSIKINRFTKDKNAIHICELLSSLTLLCGIFFIFYR